MENCEDKQIIKNGICIAENLGKCEGCANSFFKDLEEAGFKGLKIDENGIKPFGLDN